MTSAHRFLIAAGAIAVAVISIAATVAHRPNPGWAASVATGLFLYAAGLGLGRLAFGRRG